MEQENNPVKQEAVSTASPEAGCGQHQHGGQRSEGEQGPEGAPRGEGPAGRWPQISCPLPLPPARALLPAAARPLPSPCPREQSQGWVEVRQGPDSGRQTRVFYKGHQAFGEPLVHTPACGTPQTHSPFTFPHLCLYCALCLECLFLLRPSWQTHPSGQLWWLLHGDFPSLPSHLSSLPWLLSTWLLCPVPALAT